MQQIEKNKQPEFVMMIGLPGSGKSTLARKQFPDHVIHSSDALREELECDPASGKDNYRVFDVLHGRVKRDLLAGKSCVMDATNLNRKRRMGTLRILRNVPCRKVCVLMLAAPDECKKRNGQRGATVPESVIDRMLKGFDIPGFWEGWEAIHIAADDTPLDVPWHLVDGMDQQSPYHSFTLGRHMREARKYASEHGFDGGVILAARYHDLGKFYTKTWDEERQTAHYYGHDRLGAYMFLCFALCGRQFENREASPDDARRMHRMILDTANLIAWHMRPFAWEKNAGLEKKERELLGQEMYQQLMQLHEADLAAQHGTDEDG